MVQEAYAHTPPPDDKDRWHPLVDHLTSVAKKAREFAEPFDGGDLAYWLGLWHDLGKFNPEFQKYLRRCVADPNAKGHGPDHKDAGATLAAQYLGQLAMPIHGHHGGLKSLTDLKNLVRGQHTDSVIAQVLERARQELPGLAPSRPPEIPKFAEKDEVSAELFTRLLFSALVDADYLDTEAHFNQGQGSQRGSDITMKELWERFKRDQLKFSTVPDTDVNKVRREIYQACLTAAERPPGMFKLTVPTGGGKTRSGIAFALRHAMLYGQKQIIVAVPFISITEQTAQEYRSIFETTNQTAPVVLEHHSMAEYSDSTGNDFHPKEVWARLSTENWDAPIVVTTTVQLFESLFSNSPSKCRKLHHLANSIIILDEAQALPTHLLSPILDVLKQLSDNYGSTVVLSTATQPAFESIPTFAEAQASEIIPNPAKYFNELRRVAYRWNISSSLSYHDVADIIREQRQCLAVLNTKKDAIALLDALDDSNAYHLSTLLCGAHRRKVIEEIKDLLHNAQPCRLISTQVIEAGVDLDFPMVLRAIGPLDSIIQAAGRCNREGKPKQGEVIVFQPEEGGLPPGYYRTATQTAVAMIGQGDIDLDDPATMRSYFQRLFQVLGPDRENIQQQRKALNYPEVSRRFHMIGDDTESVVITSYGVSEERESVRRTLERLRIGDPRARQLKRSIQPYIVNVRTKEARRYYQQGLITTIMPSIGEWHGRYDPIRGLTADKMELEALVI